MNRRFLSVSSRLFLAVFGTSCCCPGLAQELPDLRPPKQGADNLEVTLLVRQMILDKYSSDHTGNLTEDDKNRLISDAVRARKHAQERFLKRFDRDGDGKLSPEEELEVRRHVERLRGHRGRPDPHRPYDDKSQPHNVQAPPVPGADPRHMVDVRTPGKKHFKVAPGLFLLTRDMLMGKYDTNGNGRLDKDEHSRLMQDAYVLYRSLLKTMKERYDLDQDGVISSMEREIALEESRRNRPDNLSQKPDDIELFICANICEVLLMETADPEPVNDHGDVDLPQE